MSSRRPPPRPRGGRPPLPANLQRRHRIKISLNDEEHATVLERADVAGLSPARYAREATLGRSLASRIDRRALAQLARAGNLLNQAMRYTHQTQRPADVEHAIVSAAEAMKNAMRELVP